MDGDITEIVWTLTWMGATKHKTTYEMNKMQKTCIVNTSTSMQQENGQKVNEKKQWNESLPPHINSSSTDDKLR